MEAVILCGMQGSGKTTLYRDRFLETHVRISMDLTRTRAREAALVRACLESGQRFVVDNTNPSPADRRRCVSAAAVAGTGRRLIKPAPEEGFDELWHATAGLDGGWRIEPLLTTPPLP